MIESGTEIFCYDNKEDAFYSISSIKPAQGWMTGIISDTVHVVRVECMSEENASSVKVIPSELTPDQVSGSGDPQLKQNLDVSQAEIDLFLSEGEHASLKITDGAHHSTIYVRNSPPQNWWLN